MGLFRQILVPIAFDDAMQPAIDLALELAASQAAGITLVHAFDLNGFFTETLGAPAIDVSPILASLEHEVAAVRDATRARWPRVDSVFRTGRIADVVFEVAREKGCDLVVVGTHGRKGLAHLLLGSVAERIIRLSPIPVLTVGPLAASAKAEKAHARPAVKEREERSGHS